MTEASEAVLSWIAGARLRPDKRVIGPLWWIYARRETGRNLVDPPPDDLTEQQRQRIDAAVISHLIESTVSRSSSKRVEAHFQSAAVRFLRDHPEQLERFTKLTRQCPPMARKAARTIINRVRQLGGA